MSSLLSTYDLRGLALPNRVVMGPMRARAPSRGLPTELMAEYYAQRASAGLIVTEATNVSRASAAFELTPGPSTMLRPPAGRSSPMPCTRTAAGSSRSCGTAAGSAR